MKIIYFSPHPNIHLNISSGPGVHIREMIKAMGELGHTVIPLIMGGHDLSEQAVSMSSPTPHPSKTTLKTKLKSFVPPKIWQTAKDYRLLRFDRHAQRTLEELIVKEQPDLIYERAFFMSTAGVRAAEKHGVKHILEMNAPYPEERRSMEGPGFLDALGSKREREQIAKTHRVVVVSSALKNYIEGCLAGASTKTVITPNAIHNGFKEPLQQEVSEKRRALNLTDKLTIGFIGSIFPYHGVDRLIDAFAALSSQRSDLALLIVGDGAILPELKKQAANVTNSHAIVFAGKIPHQDAALYISMMDICVMPHSNWYGSPVKVFEYGALGKPIVAPNFAPLSDVIVSGVDGLLFDEGELQKTLSTVVNNPDKAREMARNFQAKVFSRHTWTRMAALVLEESA